MLWGPGAGAEKGWRVQGHNQGTALAVKPQAANQETDGVEDTLSLLLKGTSQRVAIGSTMAAQGDEAPQSGQEMGRGRANLPLGARPHPAGPSAFPLLARLPRARVCD